MRVQATFALLFVVGCSDPIPSARDKPDAWLEVFNFAGQWERVATIHGYWDNHEGCTDIANALEEKYNRDYRCVLSK